MAPRPALAQLVPQLLEMDVVLAPSAPYHVKVDIGQAKFLRFSCQGGPADVVISLSTYAERADPLLFLSLDPNKAPTFQQHDASSFGQWREDTAGDHYVTANGVGPRGGILGLVNMRHFAGEAMDGILSIHCTFIVAFDTLFWDHLRSSSVCPLGGHLGRLEDHSFCSGRGRCGKHGTCSCDGGYAGAACEHSQEDIVVAAEGHYKFKVATGHYQYFRIRVPPRFPGGYMEVNVRSEDPLVVLVRNNDLPTKSTFDMSNFDDWVSQRNTSSLKYQVMPGSTLADLPGISSVPPTMGRRTSTVGTEGGRSARWAGPARSAGPQRPGGFPEGGDHLENLGQLPEEALPRKLQVQCPAIKLPANSPSCRAPSFAHCSSSCDRCVGCVKSSKEDQGCTLACNSCTSPACIDALARCAGNVSCSGYEAAQCQARCSTCFGCFDSNDRNCNKCHCCNDCLPLAAKCSVMLQQPAESSRFLFVGVFNHRRYFNDRSVISASASIKLTADPYFDRKDVPKSWVAELYDNFHDIHSLESTQWRQVYPDGEQYVYDVQLGQAEELNLEVRLYRDRLTLLHVKNDARAESMEIKFDAGSKVTHILSSSNAVPKTLFDFDNIHTQVYERVVIHANAKSQLWCAIFGATDGFVHIRVKDNGLGEYSKVGETVGAPLPPVGFALVCVFALLCGILILAVIYGGAQSLGESLGMDTSMTLSERFVSLVRPHNPHESTASLTRSGSLTGYVGSDVIDRSVEDQYLHRGGMGDDGI